MSHLPASQHMAEPGMEDTVDGCHPMAESKSGHRLKGQRRGGADRCSLKPVRDPAEKCFPRLCLRQEPGRGPSPPKQAQGDAKTPTRFGWILLGTKSPGDSVKRPVSLGLSQGGHSPGSHSRASHQAATPGQGRHVLEESELFPPVHLLTVAFSVFFPSKMPPGKPYSIPTEQEKGLVPPRVAEMLGKERGWRGLGGGTAL